MTTPTWEPVGQEALEWIKESYIYYDAEDGVSWGDGRIDDAIGVNVSMAVEAMATELLAARALLVALVEAIDSERMIGPEGGTIDALRAIRAHVARLKGRTGMIDKAKLAQDYAERIWRWVQDMPMPPEALRDSGTFGEAVPEESVPVKIDPQINTTRFVQHLQMPDEGPEAISIEEAERRGWRFDTED